MDDALHLALLTMLVALAVTPLALSSRRASRPARHVPALRRALMTIPFAAYAIWAVSLVPRVALYDAGRLWLVELGVAIMAWMAWSALVSLALTLVLLARDHAQQSRLR